MTLNLNIFQAQLHLTLMKLMTIESDLNRVTIMQWGRLGVSLFIYLLDQYSGAWCNRATTLLQHASQNMTSVLVLFVILGGLF